MSYSITFGDVAENHIGNQQIGSIASHGFSEDELLDAKDKFEAKGCLCELIHIRYDETFVLVIRNGVKAENHIGNQQIGSIASHGFIEDELLDVKDKFEAKGCLCELNHIRHDEAFVLVIRNGVKAFGDADKLLKEQQTLDYDTKALMRGVVKNKRARYNICFSDQSQEPDYPAGKGRIVAFNDVPLLNNIRTQLPHYLGTRVANLPAEGNHYYDMNKCYIGFHGDSERRLVIAIRLGQSHPLFYQWYHQSQPVGDRIRLDLNHGDMYIMSDKAVGNNWKSRSIYTLRHAAGNEKYI